MINILTRTRQENYYLNDFNDSHTKKLVIMWPPFTVGF